MTQEELDEIFRLRQREMDEVKEILRQHKAWLIGKFEGKQADLHGVNLHGADLQDDDLRYVDFQDAILCHVDLWFADLHGVDLRRIADRFIPLSQFHPAGGGGGRKTDEVYCKLFIRKRQFGNGSFADRNGIPA